MGTGDEVCPDFHVCRNGAKCVESLTEEGNYYCDCDQSDPEHAYAGLSCEHESTVYCNQYNRKSYTSFCTNMGTCKTLVGVNDKHVGCNCVDPYTGDFCEFLQGQKVPKNKSALTVSANIARTNHSSANATTIVCSLLAVMVVLSVAFFALKKYFPKQKQEPKTPKGLQVGGIPCPDELEADGSILKHAMEALQNINSKSDVVPTYPTFTPSATRATFAVHDDDDEDTSSTPGATRATFVVDDDDAEEDKPPKHQDDESDHDNDDENKIV